METEKPDVKFWHSPSAAITAWTGRMLLPTSVSHPAPMPSGSQPSTSAAGQLPGFSTFLTRCRPPNGLAVHPATRKPHDLTAGILLSRITASSSNAPDFSCRGPVALSHMNTGDMSAELSVNSQHIAPASNLDSSFTNAHLYGSADFQYSPMTRTIGPESRQSTADDLQQSNPPLFRPVGVVMKNDVNTAFVPQPNQIFCQPRVPNAGLVYHSAASATNLHWTPTSAIATMPDQHSPYNQSTSHQIDQDHLFGQVCLGQHDFPNNPMHWPSINRTTSHLSECETTSSSTSHRPTDIHPPPPPLLHMSTNREAETVPRLRAHGLQVQVKDKVSVVTLSAHDATTYVANDSGTTSQSESELSLYDAKMQLTEASDVPSPTPTPLSPGIHPLPANAVDKYYSHISTEGEFKLNPGLNMLSDVSILVEALTPGVGENSSNTGDVASNTSVSGFMSCGPCPEMDETETGLCPPKATYVGTIQTVPDSTNHLNNSSRLKSVVMHRTEADFAEIDPTPLQNVCCTEDIQILEPLEEKYTLMLPPKKSTKFTGNILADSFAPHYVKLSKKRDKKVQRMSGDGVENMEGKTRRGRPKKKVDQNAIEYDSHVGKPVKRNRTKKQKILGGECDVTSKTQRSIQTRSLKERLQSKENACQTDYTQQEDDLTTSKTDENDNIKGNLKDEKLFQEETVVSADDLPVQFQMEGVQEGKCTNVSSDNAWDTSQESITCSVKLLYGGNYLDKTHETSTKNRIILSSSSEATTTYQGDEQSAATVCASKTDLDYEIINTKDDLDPLIIAEEEVTSTQTHDDIDQPKEYSAAKVVGDLKRNVALRRRAHMCASCLIFPSSSDESDLSSSESQTCYPEDKNLRKKHKKSPPVIMKNEIPKESPNLVCQVCSRKFSSKSNLHRHRRFFHPSLLHETHIREIPFVSQVQPTLPLSPSSIPSVKSPSSLKNGTTEADEQDRQGSRGHHKLRTKTKKRKLKISSSDDEVWEPKAQYLKKKAKQECGPYENRSICENSRPQKQKTTTTKKKTKATPHMKRPKSHKKSSSGGHWTGSALNFRTKKRTRVNSTIPCPYCKKLFSVMSNLKRHTKKQHRDSLVFVCNVCLLKFDTRRTLKKHTKKHAKEFPFSCPDCLHNFHQESELSAHSRLHNIARYPCNDCNLVFYIEEHLADHMSDYHLTPSIHFRLKTAV